MKIRKGTGCPNHNQTLVRDAKKPKGLKIKTHVKAGRAKLNNSETLVRDGRKLNGVKVKTNLRR